MSAPGSPSLSFRVANAPCSWGVLEFDLPGEKIGYEQVLNEIRDTGYSGTELGDWGFMPTDPVRLREQLDARGLALIGAFVPVDFSNPSAHAEGERRAVRVARLMADAVGAGPLVQLADDNGKNHDRTKHAGRIKPEQGLSDSQWEVYCRGVSIVAESIRRETGLRSVFHHHCAGFVETPDEIEKLMAGVAPELAGLCFDTGHYRFGGGPDPVAAYRQFKDRIWHIHLKDCHPVVRQESREGEWDYFESLKHGIFCELGRGDINFAGLIQELEKDHYPGWVVVEQDVLPGRGTPKAYAQANREYLRNCGI